MRSKPDDALQEAQEEALRVLSLLTLLLWTPVFALGLLMRWDEQRLRPLIVLVLVGVPLIGLLLRQRTWAVETRARLAITLIMAISLPSMLVNSPRAISTMAVAVVLTLTLLFFRLRTALLVLALYLAVVVTGLILSARGIVAPTRPEHLQPMTYRVVTIAVMFTGLWFSAYVLQQTVRIYRRAQAAAEQRLQALLDAQREAELLQRRELVNTVTTGLAHDLANVVQVMSSTAELLSAESLPLEARQAVADLRQVGDEATVRLRTVLSVGRPPSPAERHASLDELFSRLDLMLRPLLGRQIVLELVRESAVPVVALDRGRLEQVLLNLALNARDAMPDGGTLRVAARGADGGVAIDVTDTGSGIAPEDRARIWEPFYTTKTAGRGTGLGLAMVARILESVRGRVRVTSDVGVGTTFSLWLPAVVTTA